MIKVLFLFYFKSRMKWGKNIIIWKYIFICMKKIRYMDIWLKINIFFKVFIENMLIVKLMRVIL